MAKYIERIMGGRGKFFHYSVEKYDVLKSKNAQKGEPLKVVPEIKTFDDLNYDDNISLFIEPIPLDIIGHIYNNHPFYVPGKKLYQYEIRTDDVPKDLFYRFVETKTKEEWYKKYGNDDSVSDEEYFRTLFDRQVQLKEIGYSLSDMVSTASKLIGKTRKLFEIAAKKNPDSVKYAAYVPHIMVYPKGGKINIHSVQEVVIA